MIKPLKGCYCLCCWESGESCEWVDADWRGKFWSHPTIIFSRHWHSIWFFLHLKPSEYRFCSSFIFHTKQKSLFKIERKTPEFYKRRSHLYSITFTIEHNLSFLLCLFHNWFVYLTLILLKIVESILRWIISLFTLCENFSL